MSIDLVIFDLESVAELPCAGAGGARANPVLELFGAARAFERLRSRGARIAIVAPITRAEAKSAIDDLGWHGGAIDALVTSDDVERPRPYPDLVQRAMREVGVRAKGRVTAIAASPTAALEGALAGCSIIVGVTNRGFSAAAFRCSPATHLLATAALVPELIERLDRPGPTVARAMH